MKNIYVLSLLVIITISISACKKSDCDPNQNGQDSTNYYVLSVKPEKPTEGLTFIDVDSYQQTTEYTCGPASVVSLLGYYGMSGDEMAIASEMGTNSTNGTNPDQMTNWLNQNGFTASWHKNGTLEMLRTNLANNIPTLVEWIDWGGHWVLVIGYDVRNPEDIMDDVIIFADPYDHHDDNPDGISWFNAQRFYYMWFDALYFGNLTMRVYINAVPNAKL
jgi:hypothetical protein